MLYSPQQNKTEPKKLDRLTNLTYLAESTSVKQSQPRQITLTDPVLQINDLSNSFVLSCLCLLVGLAYYMLTFVFTADHSSPDKTKVNLFSGKIIGQLEPLAASIGCNGLYEAVKTK